MDETIVALVPLVFVSFLFLFLLSFFPLFCLFLFLLFLCFSFSFFSLLVFCVVFFFSLFCVVVSCWLWRSFLLATFGAQEWPLLPTFPPHDLHDDHLFIYAFESLVSSRGQLSLYDSLVSFAYEHVFSID